MSSTSEAGISNAVLEVKIGSSVEAVWRSITEDIGSWWPDGAYSGGTSGARSFSLDPRPGGLMVESWESGGGILWGQVASIQPRKTLQVIGHTFPNWGGPMVWFGTWELEADGDGTVLRFTESVLGPVPDVTREDRAKGWHFIYHDALKAHLEGTPTPVWGD